MNEAKNQLDEFATGLALRMIKWRWLVILLVVAISLAIGNGASKLAFSNNYRVFFSPENPDLQTFEKFQGTYNKNDNFLFVLEPRDNRSVFTNETLAAVELLTDQGWQIPYVQRVDSLSNFQHTHAIGDDLIVEDLIEHARSLTPNELAGKREIALAEPLLRNQLVTADGGVTAVNVVLQYPEIAFDEVPEAVMVARQLRDQIEQEFPQLDVHLTGETMLNNAFSEATLDDFSFLVPMMFLIILLMTAITIRSLSATAATLAIVLLSSIIAMGFAGYIGISLAGPSATAPIIILTLAIADSIHILVSMRSAMRDGVEKHKAIIESSRINFQPIAVTSITTMIGFLALNFADSPPFRDLGTITAAGIFAAWVLSMTLLPALLSLAPIHVKPRKANEIRSHVMLRLANFVIARSRVLLVTIGLATVGLISFIPTIDLSDLWTEYFAPRIEFRSENDEVIKHFGTFTVEYSIPAGEPGGISDPDFLRKLEAYKNWLLLQPDVTHVYSITDIMKRLNKNLNADDPTFYRLPEDRELSAQYLLLYELSLPYGLDLNNRINIDKSATRVTVTLDGHVATKRAREFLRQSEQWFKEYAPMMNASATGPQLMFAFIAERNVQSMIQSTLIAIIAIALIMILALRSVGMGVISLIPNALPILAAFGAWAILIGDIGMSVAAIASIALGIVVDDTVHFLMKFMRARREQGLSCADAVRYTFETVGVAIIVNTMILSAGFIVLISSAFKVNSDLGFLTSTTIIFALIFDFLFLPAMLLMFARLSGETIDSKGDNYVRPEFTQHA